MLQHPIRFIVSRIPTFPVRWLMLCVALAMVAPTLRAQEEDNTWEMVGGRSFEAEFVRATESGVVLRSVASGAEKEFSFSQLSIASHFKAKKMANPKAYSKPLPKAPVKEIVKPAEPEFTVDVSTLVEYPFPEDPTIEEWIAVLEKGAAENNFMVAWHSMPERMQNDIEDIVVDAGGMLSDGQYKQINSLMASVRKIVTEQKDYIFGNTYFKQIPVDPADLEELWPTAAGLVASLTDSRHWQKENFTEGNFVPALSVFVAEVTPHVFATEQTVIKFFPLPPGAPSSQDKPTYKIVNSGKDRATVEVTLAGATTTVQYQKVGKKWVIPKQANQVRKGLDEAKKQLASFDRSQIGGISNIVGSIIPPFALLAEAKSQAEFDRYVEIVKNAIEGAAGGMMGGGGRPPQSGGGRPGGGGPSGGRPGGSSKGPTGASVGG